MGRREHLKRGLVVALLLWDTLLTAGTTGVLEGLVRSGNTGEPLLGVNVMVLGTRLGISTDTKGNFLIHNIPAGTYTVEFRMIGHRVLRVEKVEIRPDLKTRLDRVILEETPVSMDAVVIQAEKPLIQKDVTGSTIRVSNERVRRLPISTTMDILAMQTGVTDEGNIRGGRIQEVSYLIDGVPARDMIQGDLGIHLPRSAVMEMNIQTGGFDSEYGNALSGVVNVITKRGTNVFHTFLAVQTDGTPSVTQRDQATRIEITTEGAIIKNRLFYFASAEGYFTDTRWWQDFQRYFPSPISSEFTGFARLDGQIGSRIRVSAQFLASQKQWKDYEFTWRYNLYGLPARNRLGLWGTLEWSHMLSKKTFYTVHLGIFQLQNRIGEEKKGEMVLVPYQYDFYLQYIVSGNRCWWMDNRQGIGTVRADLTSQIFEKHLFRGGFQFNTYSIDADIVKYEPQTTYFGKPLLDRPLLNFSTAYTYYPFSGGVYIQDKWELAQDGGMLSMGLRYDFLEPGAERPLVEYIPVDTNEYRGEVLGSIKARFKGVFGARLGFSAPLSDRTFFFANIGTYTQFPAFHYLYAGLDNVAFRSGMNVLKGNPDLEPETCLNSEVSVKTLIPWQGVVTMTIFMKHAKNQIDTKTFVPTNSRIAGDYGFAEYVNNDRTDVIGFECTVSKEKGRWVTGSLSYTWMHARGISATSEQGIQYFQWGLPLSSSLYDLSWDQRHTFKAVLEFRSPWGMELNVYWQVHTPRPYTYYPSQDGFTPLDPELPFVPNNGRMTPYRVVHAKLSQSLIFGSSVIDRCTLTIDCRNLFNVRNILWMDSSGRVGGELADPGGYDVGRRTNVGLEILF